MSGRNATHTARGSRALRSLQLVSAAALAAIPGAAASAQYVFDDTTTSATAQGTLNTGGLYGQVYTSFPNQRFNVGGNALNPGAFNVPANPLFHPDGFLTLQTQLNNSSPTASGGTAFSNVPFSNPDNSNTYGAGAPFGGTNTTIMTVATIDDLTARWSGYFNATAAGTFTFSTRSDDGSVVYIDGVRMNGFGGNNAFQGATTRGGTINLSAGLHEIVVAFFEGNGGAGVTLHNNLVSNGNQNVIPVMSGTNQILLGVQNTPLASGSNVTLAGSAPATLAVQGALVTQFGDLTVTSPNASLVLQGTTGRFNNTIINTGGPATVTLSGATNSAFAQDFYLGALNDNGNATTINNGRNTLILDNTATANTAGSTTFNVNGGGMVLVGAAAGQDPAGGAAINLNAAPNSNVAVANLVLSSKTGTALFPSRINVTDNAVIGSYQFGSSGTGVTTALTNPNGLAVPAGKTLTIGSDQGNTLRIDGPISGPGTLRIANAISGRTANVPTGNVTINGGTNVSDLGGNVLMNQAGTLTINSPVQLGSGSQFVMNTTNNTATQFPANVSGLGTPTVTATNSVVGGNLYIAHGTYNANAASAMKFGSITSPVNLALGAHVINYNANNAAGTQNTNLNVTASGGTAGLNLNLSNNVTSLGGDTFSVAANNIIGVSGTTVAPLLNRAPGGNLVLSPNAILAANSAAALAAVQNLGTDSDIYAGLNATWGSPQNSTIGPGTPFKGLSVDRSDRRYAGGTVTLTGPAEIHSFNGYNGAGTNQVTFGSFGGRLQLGNGTNAGIFNMVSSDGTSRHPVTLTGYTFLQNGGAGLGATAQANLSNLSGVSKFIVSPGAILQTDTTNAFGGAGGTAKPTVEVMPGGLIDPGIGNTNAGTLTGSLNTDIQLHPGATMLINDNGNFASADGVITGAAGTIYRVEGTGQPFLGQQQGTGSVPGSVVRLAGSNFTGFDAAFDDGVVLVTRGGDRTISGDWGINGEVTGPAANQISGVLTNDDASRRFSSGITGSSNVATINVGPLGATFAATNNGTSLTTFTIGNSATNLSRLNVIGPSGKVTIGSPVAIDGFTKNGTVVWTGQNTNGGPMAEWNTGAVDVVSGNFQHAGGGATYNVGGASGTGITRIFSGAAFDVNTGIQINTTAQIDSGGTLRMRGSGNGNSAISGISGAGSLVLGSGATNVANVTVTVGANNESTTFSGLISSNFGTNTTNLTKTGAGTLTLTGANTYRGTTSVGAGTLLVNNTAGSGTGAGPVTVASGATVGGTGNVGANLTTALVNVATGGNLSPGSGGVGTLTVTNANANPGTGNGATALLASGSNFNADLDFGGGVYDQLKVLGTVQLDGSNLNILATGTPLGTETITLVDNDAADAVGGTFAGRPEGSVVDIFGTPYTLTYAGGDGNDVVLVGVPEPGAIGALGLAAAAALMRRRRRG